MSASTWVKTAKTIQASTSNSAGSTTTGTAASVSTGGGGVLMARVTNGATGPTLGAVVTVLGGYPGGSTDRTLYQQLCQTTANAVTDVVLPIDAGIASINVVFSGNTGQAVTVDAYLSSIDSVSTA